MKSKSLIIGILFAGAFLLLFVVVNKETTVRQRLAIGLAMPDFEILDAAQATRLTSYDVRNKVLFINFWASWCKPCREEMPSINALYNILSTNDDFRMITIIYKEETKISLEYMSKNGYSFPVFSDPKGKAAVNFGVTGVPETYIFNKKGIVVQRELGPAQWDSPEKVTFIESQLNE